MSLLEAIHQRWAASAALNDLLPASRVYTGIGAELVMPYAVITRLSDRPSAYHNDGSTVTTVGVRIDVLHDNYDSAEAIVSQILAAFNRSDFALSSADKVINMQQSNNFHRQEDNDTWRMVIDFDCTVYIA